MRAIRIHPAAMSNLALGIRKTIGDANLPSESVTHSQGTSLPSQGVGEKE